MCTVYWAYIWLQFTQQYSKAPNTCGYTVANKHVEWKTKFERNLRQSLREHLIQSLPGNPSYPSYRKSKSFPEYPIPALGTKRGILDPLVSKRTEKNVKNGQNYQNGQNGQK